MTAAGGGPLTLRAGPVSGLVERGTVRACAALAAAAAVLALAGLCRGDTWDSPAEVARALADGSVVVVEWRMPRVAAGLVFGAALGLAGAVFQNITRNPLGSPDVIGLDAGAYTGVLVAVTVLGGSSVGLGTASLAGGLGAAAAVYVLSARGGMDGLRLVVVGIAVNATLTAFNAWIVLRADLEVAMAATGWNAGSLNGLDWAELIWPCAVVAGCAVLLAAAFRAMHQAALGDEVAVTTGVRPEALRPVLVVAGVGCVATVTAAAGPIVFVALAAPQIGRRLAGAAGVPLVPAALTGAVLLSAADIAARSVTETPLPVGVVTTAFGGTYLIGLLVKEMRNP